MRELIEAPALSRPAKPMKKSAKKHIQRQDRFDRLQDDLLDHALSETEGKPLPRLPDEEAARQSLVEQRLQQAMAEGKFDNLPGHGKPLDLNDNPYLESGQELAFGLLKQNGFAPEWIERDKAIRQRVADAREGLHRVWASGPSDSVWQTAVSRFGQELGQINQLIDSLNLIVPVASCQRNRLQLEMEVNQLMLDDECQRGDH